MKHSQPREREMTQHDEAAYPPSTHPVDRFGDVAKILLRCVFIFEDRKSASEILMQSLGKR